MKLSQYAKQLGIHYQTALRWFHDGIISNSKQLPTGTIIIKENSQNFQEENNKSASIYCRVSSHNKKDDLERQVQRCTEFCHNQGMSINKIYKEIASGMNDNRPQLIKLLQSKPTHIIVEHKDRLTRFGFNYFDTLLPQLNCKLIVINRDFEEENDLIKDLVSIITSYCCRLYGIRKGQNKSKLIQKEINRS
jgi:predicted site-specific integrase-resolvase